MEPMPTGISFIVMQYAYTIRSLIIIIDDATFITIQNHSKSFVCIAHFSFSHLIRNEMKVIIRNAFMNLPFGEHYTHVQSCGIDCVLLLLTGCDVCALFIRLFQRSDDFSTSNSHKTLGHTPWMCVCLCFIPTDFFYILLWVERYARLHDGRTHVVSMPFATRWCHILLLSFLCALCVCGFLYRCSLYPKNEQQKNCLTARRFLILPAIRTSVDWANRLLVSTGQHQTDNAATKKKRIENTSFLI